jgi:hypothetical protein
VPPSLRDIPGIDSDRRQGGRRRGRQRGRQWGRGSGSLSFGPRSLRLDTGDRRSARGWRGRLRRIQWGAALAWVLGLGTLALVAVLAYRGTRVHLEQTGLEDGAALNALTVAATDVRIQLSSPEDAEGAELRFDGELVEEPDREGTTLRWRPPQDLAEGDHHLTLRVPRVLLAPAEFTWDFTVDRTVPTIETPPVTDPVAIDSGAAIAGTVERGAELSVAGGDVDVDDEGGFRVAFDRAPAGPVTLEAVDRAGNSATVSVVVPVEYPSMRSVAISAAGWSDERLRSAIVRLLDERRIDTVVLDLKDESGVVGFDTEVARARQIGAVTPYVALDDAVATVHDHGGRLVGRIAAFQDPILAQAAWGAGQTDQVIQRPDGSPYDAPGRFTNFAHPEVQRYNLDIALDAVRRGVHDILWDEVRRPGDDATGVVVPQLEGPASDALLGFLAHSHSELRRRGAYQGLGVGGLAVESGSLVGQDVAQMARRVDYMVPTIHPAYWSAGQFGVPNPITQPADIVNRVLARFAQVTENSGVRLVPSLQDFSARGVSYGPAEVRAQIDGARLAGAAGFVLYDVSATYTAEALDPQPE